MRSAFGLPALERPTDRPTEARVSKRKFFARVTHGALCPVDVVKTRIQLDPIKYNKGMFGGFKQVVGEEGIGALATGLGPTVVGYFIQGWFKFGGVEFFKINMAKMMGD